MKAGLSAIRAYVGAAPGPVRGMALMLLATFLSAVMIGCARAVSAEIHPNEITFFRSIVGFLVFVPIFFRHGLEPLRTRRIGLHATRGVIHAAASLLFYLGVAMSPLAKVTALFFSAPLFAALLALLVLRETVHARRVAAIAAGFAGTLIVMRPGTGAFDAGAYVIVASAALWGLALAIIKALSRTESSLTMTLYMGIFMTPISLVAAVPYWQTPNLEQLAWLIAVGVLGGLDHWVLAQAYKEADMTAVLPLDFTRLLWTSLIGYLAFAEVPDAWTWIGGAVIFAAAAYLSVRETRRS